MHSHTANNDGSRHPHTCTCELSPPAHSTYHTLHIRCNHMPFHDTYRVFVSIHCSCIVPYELVRNWTRRVSKHGYPITHALTHSLASVLPSFLLSSRSLASPAHPPLAPYLLPSPIHGSHPPLTFPHLPLHVLPHHPGSLLVIFFGALIYAYDDLQFNATGYVTQNTYSSTNRQILIRRGIHPVVCVLGSMLRRPSIQRHKERSPFISTAPRRNRTHTNAYERKRILNSTETPQHPPTK